MSNNEIKTSDKIKAFFKRLFDRSRKYLTGDVNTVRKEVRKEKTSEIYRYNDEKEHIRRTSPDYNTVQNKLYDAELRHQENQEKISREGQERIDKAQRTGITRRAFVGALAVGAASIIVPPVSNVLGNLSNQHESNDFDNLTDKELEELGFTPETYKDYLDFKNSIYDLPTQAEIESLSAQLSKLGSSSSVEAQNIIDRLSAAPSQEELNKYGEELENLSLTLVQERIGKVTNLDPLEIKPYWHPEDICNVSFFHDPHTPSATFTRTGDNYGMPSISYESVLFTSQRADFVEQETYSLDDLKEFMKNIESFVYRDFQLKDSGELVAGKSRHREEETR